LWRAEARVAASGRAQEVRADVERHPVPVEGPPHARAELQRLLAPPPDTRDVPWKWDALRDFAAT
jgi:elongator complex protein 1